MREPRTSGRGLAREIGVDKDTLSAWRQGKSRPRPYQLPKLAEALGIDLKELEPDSAIPSPQVVAATAPDVLGLLDELARLSDVAQALTKVGEGAPDIAKALRQAKRLRRALGR